MLTKINPALRSGQCTAVYTAARYLDMYLTLEDHRLQ